VRRWDVLLDYANQWEIQQAATKRKRNQAKRKLVARWTKRERARLQREVHRATARLLQPAIKEQLKLRFPALRTLTKEFNLWKKRPPQTKKDWHQLRLFIKKWRYTLQVRQSADPRSKPDKPMPDKQMRELIDLQDTLGELHDLEDCQKKFGRDFPAARLQKRRAARAALDFVRVFGASRRSPRIV
jgi:CHAD domain-containing protein